MEDKKNNLGKLIILEGIDGCGGETQSKLLSESLTRKGKKVKVFSFPDYDSPIGQFLDSYFHGKYELSPENQTLFQYAGFLNSKKKIEEALSQGYIIICDRYVTATMAYQGIQGIDYEKIIQLINAFPIPKPDIVIYLKISPETSAKRKMGEKGHLDRFEADKNFLQKVEQKYSNYAQKNIYCKQEIINAEKSIEEVSSEIINIVDKII
ncbi:MAG: dTMP kinase [Candidatus Pacebacteria bacterium]|nr:dTMP kinase [Candidatus Paceibacterota bacterium]